MQRRVAGELVPNFEIKTIQGRVVRSGELGPGPTLLIFHRYARCAICNQRIRELTSALPKLRAETGLRVLFVCHSDRRRLLNEFGDRDLPFELVADPDRDFYETFGVGQSLAKTLKPASVISIFRARRQMPKDGKPAGLERPLTVMPSDFLIDGSGRIVSAHYGEFLGDTWPIDTIARLAHEHRARPAQASSV